MFESWIKVQEGTMFVRHNNFDNSKPTILFIHGLGESSLCFLEAFESNLDNKFNIIAPDQLGYGRSTLATNGKYSLNLQTKRLYELLNNSKFLTQKLNIVGHSLGGDIATLFCSLCLSKNSIFSIGSLINVEGNLTPSDLFISKEAALASKKDDFDNWFRNDFMKDIVIKKWAKYGEISLRYYTSLWFCRADAFKDNAVETYERNLPIPGNLHCKSGKDFAELKLSKKIYCWCDKSISNETVNFLQMNKINNKGFSDSFHWPMIDHSKEFYDFINAFIS